MSSHSGALRRHDRNPLASPPGAGPVLADSLPGDRSRDFTLAAGYTLLVALVGRFPVTDGVTGVVVPPDADALRAAMLDVVDPARAEHYRAMGERAREHVLAHHMLDDYFDTVLLDAVGLPPADSTR